MSEKEMKDVQEVEKNAGCVGIGFSFLIPIIGVILYFGKKNSVLNPKAYLYAALAGFIFAVIVNIIAGAAGA